MMDTTSIMRAAIATVGVVQLIKNMLNNKGNKVIWTIITILVGIGICTMQYLCPSAVMDSVITVSGASIFYDTIYQTFEKIFKKGGE